MRIERAILREIRMQLRSPFRSSKGTVTARRVLLLTLEGEGLEAWSECVAGVDPSSTETVDSAWNELVGELLPRAMGRDYEEPEDVVGLPREGERRRMARATLEMAAWDLAARADAVSLSRKLGGTMHEVPAGVSIGLQPSDAELLEVVRAHVDDGYARIKIKIEPGRDVEMLAAVREQFPEASLWADANAAYTLHDTAQLRRLDALGLGLIEQPLRADDLMGHARLQEQLRTAICLDEAIASEGDARAALEVGACRVVNLKSGRLGGYGETRRIHDFVRAVDMPMWCGGMLETGIGRAHNLALASLPGFTLAGDISASRRYWDQDIVTPEFDVVDGCMEVPKAPGIGVEVDVDRIRALTVREAIIP